MESTEAKVTSLAELRHAQAPREAQMPAVRMGYESLQGFELMQRAAKAFSASTLVPKEYQGNTPNCMIALEMANRMGASPLMVSQNLYIVHGRPGWSAQFLIATFNQNGKFTALRYEFFGEKGKDTWGCRAWATEKSTGEKLVGADVTIGLARSEGWYEKNGSKWKTMPQQMLMYRAASWFIRAYAPEIAMGLHTADELGDTFDASMASDGSFEVTTDELRREPVVSTPKSDAVDAEVVQPAEPTAKASPAKTAKANPDRPSSANLVDQIRAAKDIDALNDVLALANGFTWGETERIAIDSAYKGRKEVLEA